MLKTNIGIDFDNVILERKGNKGIVYDASVKCLKSLYDNDFELHLITGREKDKNKLLATNIKIIEEAGNFKFSTINFTNGKPKGTICKQLKCQYMIDDSYHYLLDCEENGVVPILFKRQNDWFSITEKLIKMNKKLIDTINQNLDDLNNKEEVKIVNQDMSIVKSEKKVEIKTKNIKINVENATFEDNSKLFN